MKAILQYIALFKDVRQAVSDGQITRQEAEQVLAVLLDIIYGKK